MQDPFKQPSYQEIQQEWVDGAEHLIVGWVPGRLEGGIIGNASDEFTARRWVKLAQKAGFIDVHVMPNNAETYLQVSEGMSQQLGEALGF
jgi:hypothetical protein